MTPEEQLDKWVDGINIHNTDRDECCPDFSCCQDKYKATTEERATFRDRPDLRDQMCIIFLAGSLEANYGKKVEVIGEQEGNA